jgi:hypothetical protein
MTLYSLTHPNIKTVKLESLAANLPIPIQVESWRRKSQCLLSLPQLNDETLSLGALLNWDVA